MNDFSKPQRSIPELIIQGSFERDIETHCNQEMLELLTQWQQRDNAADSTHEHFRVEKSQVFTISYRGDADHFWPSSKANRFSEALVRDVLFTDGICDIESFEPRLYQINFKVLAMEETEYLLVLPYPTQSGNIGGLVIVCVNHFQA